MELVLKNYDEELKDIKSGLLIHFLERGLMLNQIEAHIDMVNFIKERMKKYLIIKKKNEYCECNEPFQLIKQHLCTIVEKKKEAKLKEKIEKNNAFLETLKKTTEYQAITPQNIPVAIDDKFLLQNSRNIKLNMENVIILKKSKNI